MSAVRSSAVIGASRWLDANRLEGTSMSSAMAKATIRFILFMENLSGSEFGVRGHRGCSAAGAAPRPGSYDWLRLLVYVRAQSQIGLVAVSDSESSRSSGLG